MIDRETDIANVAADRPPLAADEQLRRTLGGLLASAVPQFYSLVPLEKQRLHDLLGNSIGARGSELQHALMAGAAPFPLGIATWLPVSQLRSAQQVSTVTLMRQIDRAEMGEFRRAVAAYGEGVEPIDAEGTYCSRITVAAEARGQGIGRALLHRLHSDGGHADVWLHVSADNDRAIAVYRKAGFKFASETAYRSRAMVRRGSMV